MNSLVRRSSQLLGLAALLTGGCAGARLELQAPASPPSSVELMRLESSFPLAAAVRGELETTLRNDLPASAASPTQQLIAQLTRHRSHHDVEIGGHGESVAYDYTTYEVRLAVLDSQQREVGSCRVAWDESDGSVSRDPVREQRAIAKGLHRAARALLGGTRSPLLADAHSR